MFDIGFTEILVIATITLIVIGPERLPETVRAMSIWIGRFKRSLRETRREIEQQIGADDIRRELHNEEVMRSLEKIRTDVSETLDKDVALEGDLYPTSRANQPSDESVSENQPEESPPESSTAPAQKESPEQQSRDPSAGSKDQ